jgi:hypothetical protein
MWASNMVKLRGEDVILWKEELKRGTGTPSQAPHLTFVSKYKCGGCGRVFYYRVADAESPQYSKFKGDKTHVLPFCHKCWHRYNLSGTIRGTECWLCDIRNARKARENGVVRHTKSIQETGPSDGTVDLGIEPTTVPWKQSRIRSGPSVPKGRRGSTNKKNGKSR